MCVWRKKNEDFVVIVTKTMHKGTEEKLQALKKQLRMKMYKFFKKDTRAQLLKTITVDANWKQKGEEIIHLHLSLTFVSAVARQLLHGIFYRKCIQCHNNQEYKMPDS